MKDITDGDQKMMDMGFHEALSCMDYYIGQGTNGKEKK